MIGRLLLGLGTYALAVALFWVALGVVTSSPYMGLIFVLYVIPYGTIGLLGLLAGWLWRRGSRGGGALALVWFLVTGAGLTFEFVANWVPRLMAIGDPSTSYNWALPEIWMPVPLALGVLAVALALASRLGGSAARPTVSNS